MKEKLIKKTIPNALMCMLLMFLPVLQLVAGGSSAFAATGTWTDITGSESYSSLYGVTAVSDNVYVTDIGNNTINILSNGSVTDITYSGDFANPNGVAVDSSGNVYVADNNNHKVKKLLNGSNSWTDITGSESFVAPFGIEVDSSGNVYVADNQAHTIKKLSNGNWTDITNSGGFSYPGGVAVDSNDNVYVIDAGNHKVKKRLNGSTEWTDITYSGNFSALQDVAVDSSGNVYVTDWGNKTIKKLSNGSTSWTDITGGESFTGPYGIAVDSSGNVYVADGTKLKKLMSAAPISAGIFASAGTTASQGITPVTVDGNLTIEYTDNGGILPGATVVIDNLQTGDSLSIDEAMAAGSDITVDKSNAANGVIILTGNASAAAYQDLLRTVKYSTTSTDISDRTIAFSMGSALPYSENGHFYYYVPLAGVSWNDAVAGASAQTYFGRQGYLATITSQGENDFIWKKTSGTGYIGARDIGRPNQEPVATTPGVGDWRWVTGPEGLSDGGNGLQFWNGYNPGSSVGAYANWASGEPNDYGGGEYVAHIFGGTGANAGKWNDFNPGDPSVQGYVIEYGGMPTDDTSIQLNTTKTISTPVTNDNVAPGGVSDGLISWVNVEKSANSPTAVGSLADLADPNRNWSHQAGGTMPYDAAAINFNAGIQATGYNGYYKADSFGTTDTEREVFSVQTSKITDTANRFPWDFGGNFNLQNSTYGNKDGNGSIVTRFGSEVARSVGVGGIDLKKPRLMDAFAAIQEWALSIDGNPLLKETSNSVNFDPPVPNTYYIGAGHFSIFQGDISETIVFNRKLDALEKLKVNSYLALKYGLTLNGGNSDYTASNGTDKMWTAADNQGYGNRITGVGRDDGSDLLQKQSKSQEQGALVTIALGDAVQASNAANTNTINNDSSFLVFSDNGATANYETDVLEAPGHTLKQLNRVFKVEKSNWQDQDITLKLDVTAENPSVLYYLIIDGVNSGITLDAAGQATFDSSRFDNGALFTFAKVYKSDLQTKLIGINGLTETNYTPESWTALRTALTNAEAVLNNPGSTQAQVDAALAALEGAQAGLVSDKDKLQAKTDEVQNEITIGTLIPGDYTTGSWADLTKALEDANDLLTSPQATPEELGQALSALESARSSLVDLSELRAKEAEIAAENLNPATYTPSSWQVLQQTLTAAQAVLADPDATQAEVDEAKLTLEQARAALVPLVNIAGGMKYENGAYPTHATITVAGVTGSVNQHTGKYAVNDVPVGVYPASITIANPDNEALNATFTSTATVDDAGNVTFGPFAPIVGTPAGMSVTSDDEGNMIIHPSTAVSQIASNMTAAIDTNTLEALQAAHEEFTALTPEEQLQISRTTVELVSNAILNLLPSLNIHSVVSGSVVNPAVTRNQLDAQKGMLLTSEEIAEALINGQSLNVTLNLNATNVSTSTNQEILDDKALIETLAAPSAANIGFMYDINITKKVDVLDNSGTVIDEKSTSELVPVVPEPISITLNIPTNLLGYKYFAIVRVHNDRAEFIPSSVNGTTVRFSSTKFSTYALLYSNQEIFVDNLPGTGPSQPSSGGVIVGYKVTIGNLEGGKVIVDNSNPISGTEVTITVTPDEGYKLDKLWITDSKGNVISYTDNGNGTYTYVQPNGAVKINATFKALDKEPTTVTGVFKLLNTIEHFAYLRGYEDGTFRADAPMTRAEVAQMFYNLLKDQDVNISGTRFADVPDNAWYAKAVNTLASLGIINGYEDGTFSPDKAITRAEFTIIAVSFSNKATGNKSFTDVSSTHWAYSSIATSAEYGWVSGYPNGTFEPDKTITRAESATIVNRMLNRKPDKKAIDASTGIKAFKDLSSGYWAYYDIMEATNDHQYETSNGMEIWKM
ncbi:S-layer homology domain-containing protein [Paenibacillus sp. J5C_2022]|uniref:S-layer homology domain-containing protein n=1 Tax=Paenibacillus sp. J5C2022 TaxID=2977129 RepID=UPI0021D21EAA|nr:S-layer homology domain-containing protein [Paenibacillus sp. J5C2022]MCU6708113.1 S-layer homology domain-containing protein [Paenibacillus sp. J5C2022]